MGCFLGCFFNSKDHKRRRRSNSGSPRRKIDGGHVSTVDPVLSTPEKGANLVPQLSEKLLEKQLSLNKQKRVTFDSNVQTFERGYGSTNSLVENNIVNDDNERENEKGVAKSSESETLSVDDSTISNVGSYPRNNRYQNCRDSDDEAIDSEYEDNAVVDLDDDYDNKSDDGSMLCEKVWSEAVPAASLESRKDVLLTGVALQDGPVTFSRYAENVLSPVENLNQWKAVNSKGSQPAKQQEKENLASDSEAPRVIYSSEPNTKESSVKLQPSSPHQAKNQNKDASVDSSFSNWLVSSETKISMVEQTENNSMSQGSPPVRSIEDRPILGAWTLMELKHYSASNSPRKSPRRSNDEMPIIGTVGTYWNHEGEVEDCSSATSTEKKNSCSPTSFKGIPNTTSKYREDKKVKWHSTPFETRLERALEGGGAEA